MTAERTATHRQSKFLNSERHTCAGHKPITKCDRLPHDWAIPERSHRPRSDISLLTQLLCLQYSALATRTLIPLPSSNPRSYTFPQPTLILPSPPSPPSATTTTTITTSPKWPSSPPPSVPSLPQRSAPPSRSASHRRLSP